MVEAKLDAPGPSAMWAKFTDFMADDYDVLKVRGFSDSDIANRAMGELMPRMKEWVEANK